MAVFEGFVYIQNKYSNNKIYWKCQNSDCKTTALTSASFHEDLLISIKKDHNHNPSHDLIEALKIKNRIKINSANNLTSVSELVTNEIGNSSRAIIAHTGSTETLVQMVQYYREKNTRENDSIIPELGLPKK